MILFSSLIFSCKTKSFEVVEGKFVCDKEEFYGELELHRISEKEFVNSNDLNSFYASIARITKRRKKEDEIIKK